mmetsp:Transcript_5083/g.15500  ORF Transcript_5083/g.15500 Transcript_5083/m.15500 type:complete len:111 (-) Transcript_5083:4260-4592(-)|eukprot:scaffold172373_cov31-Tisochrysis_lutea.AAC.6
MRRPSSSRSAEASVEACETQSSGAGGEGGGGDASAAGREAPGPCEAAEREEVKAAGVRAARAVAREAAREAILCDTDGREGALSGKDNEDEVAGAEEAAAEAVRTAARAA